MPYLLPAGDAYTADRRCLIVVIPDKDEYQQALMGSLDFLGTWVAWERDSLKRGKDAARAWKEATHETRECLMICDDMMAQLEAIEHAIYAAGCCPGGQYAETLPDSMNPNLGTAIDDSSTADYGSTPVATVGDRLDYKCEAAYALVSWCADLFEEFAHFEAWEIPIPLDTIGALLGYIPLVGGIAKPAWELIVGLAELGWATASGLSGAAAAVDAAADSIACAIYQADGAAAVAAAFEAEVRTAISGYAFAAMAADYFPWEMWANVIYEGEFTDKDGVVQDLSAHLTPGTHACTCSNVYWKEGVGTGTIATHTANPVVVSSELHSGVQKSYAYAFEFDRTTKKELTITSLSLSGVSWSQIGQIHLFDDTNTTVLVVNNPTGPPTLPQSGVYGVNIQAESGVGAYTLSIGWSA